MDLQTLVANLIELGRMLLPVLAALALLVFFKGLVQFIYKAGDASSHKEGKSLMVWGLIALFILFSLNSIVFFFYDDLGFNEVKPFGLPFLPESDEI